MTAPLTRQSALAAFDNVSKRATPTNDATTDTLEPSFGIASSTEMVRAASQMSDKVWALAVQGQLLRAARRQA